MKAVPIKILFSVPILLWLAMGASPSAAASALPPVLVLDDATPSIQAWPAVAVLAVPQGILTIGGNSEWVFDVALCYALDWINVHTVTAVVSTLGLAPARLGMPLTKA